MLRLHSLVLAACLLTKTTYSSLTEANSGWHGVSSYGTMNYGSTGHDANIHQDLSSYGLYSSYGNAADFHGKLNHGFSEAHIQHTLAQSVPISEHVEVTKPVAVPVIKNIGVPVAHPVTIPVPHPVAIAVAQPYPVHVPYAQPIAVPVVKTIAIPVEKKVPYPVEKIIPVPVEKAVPITVEKHVPVPVEKPYPIHIPVYKHIFHRKTKNNIHAHGWA
ncbi:hypothetical protein DMN91_007199 [Ooceraea biroi]|uniref:Zinc finger protein n=2 Tax=Ooceraea biroi TaxID=2015173 RepID=A0A026WPW0_OOCBI|nr:hypothetical protein X777_01710 [Ooceraea biroi]RLU20588.1 hypothetical protein DMN91_007199 [Ooceraea biroi]